MPEPEDPIAEAKRLLADKALYADNVRHLWRADVAKRAPRLLAALCERLDAAERLIEYGAAHFGECHRSEDEQRHGSPCRWVRDAVAYIEATE